MAYYYSPREPSGQLAFEPYFQQKKQFFVEQQRDFYFDRQQQQQQTNHYYQPTPPQPRPRPQPPMYYRQKPSCPVHQVMEDSCDDPLKTIVPSSFPPGTDPRTVEMFNRIDRNRDGIIDDVELQSVLSNWQQKFDLRTVHLLMYLFTNSNTRMIGPNEFVPLLSCLRNWKAAFERADRDRNGRIDVSELSTALYSMGYSTSPVVVHLLILKFDRTGRQASISFDNFIECCLTIKGLSDKFKANEDQYTGQAYFTYDGFLACVIPLIIA